MHRQQEMSQVTEDDVNEVKGDISTLRFELLDVFKNNGMDISSANKNSKGFLPTMITLDVSFSQI
jgi:transient-receptor-potential-like protein